MASSAGVDDVADLRILYCYVFAHVPSDKQVQHVLNIIGSFDPEFVKVDKLKKTFSQDFYWTYCCAIQRFKTANLLWLMKIEIGNRLKTI